MNDLTDSVTMADDTRYLGTREAAQLLGVGESTVKRWADQGVLPVEVTPGKHRKIRFNDLVRIAEERNLPRAALQMLLSDRPPAGPTDPAALEEAFHAALLAVDPVLARSLLTSAHESGLSVACLGDDVVCPVMRRIGHGWQTGELDVFQEHAGTQTCLAALQGLRPRLRRPDADAPLALGGGVAGDHYLLANLLVELTLQEAGWRAENVGPNTPLPSLARAVRERKPRLVWVSVSHLTDVEAFVAGFADLTRAAGECGAAVTVGGRGLGEDVRRRIAFTNHGDTLQHLGLFALDLRRPR